MGPITGFGDGAAKLSQLGLFQPFGDNEEAAMMREKMEW